MDTMRTCKHCGCHDYDACYHPDLGNCWWISEDECSHCKIAPGLAVRASQEAMQEDEFSFDEEAEDQDNIQDRII